MKIMRCFALALLLSLYFIAARAATPSPMPAADRPASTRQMVVPSHGVMLYGIFYLAGGAGPHPTAILFHGFPGYEQNMDIAQDLRAHGWNVLAMHYRGSWGVKGNFSFEHCAEDADVQVSYVLNPANAMKYGIDTRRVIVIGHSMGGFMAASAAAHNKGVAETVLISAWNIGDEYSPTHRGMTTTQYIAAGAKLLALDNNLLPLSGTSGEALSREIYDHHSALDMNRLALGIAPRPVLVITAHDGLAPSDQAFADALRKAGDTEVAERHWDTDHSYSGVRMELSKAIVEWTQANLPK